MKDLGSENRLHRSDRSGAASAADADFMSESMTPRDIVAALDQHIIGQADAKRAVAIAMRNRWRRRQLAEDIRADVSPKNILMIGPTGVGKTEIARRLAKLTGSPFIKVEATKYTEVGYYGRDVESMIRDLVENSIAIVRRQEMQATEKVAEGRVDERLLDLLVPRRLGVDDDQDTEEQYERSRAKMAAMLATGELDNRDVELTVEQKSAPMVFSGAGLEQMDVDLQGMFEKLVPKSSVTRKLSVSQARQVLLEQESEALLDPEKINAAAIDLAENFGIVFLDEIDKVIATESKSADVSRQGVQRDLLPIVEGTTIQTKYGYIRTDHILFVAAGAFHRHSPSELMPELQGRFPIRVELTDLQKDDFVRILKEPTNSLTRQYTELLATEGVELVFGDDAIERLADYAFQVNQSTQNIGARRLYTILEQLLEELSFEAPDMSMGRVEINAAYVNDRLAAIAQDEDLSKFIL